MKNTRISVHHDGTRYIVQREFLQTHGAPTLIGRYTTLDITAQRKGPDWAKDVVQLCSQPSANIQPPAPTWREWPAQIVSEWQKNTEAENVA